jgi:hypothetical protein
MGAIKLLREWYKAPLKKFGIKWRGKGKDGGLESLEDAVKRLMDAGYYIFNIGLLRLRTSYVGVFDCG